MKMLLELLVVLLLQQLMEMIQVKPVRGNYVNYLCPTDDRKNANYNW